MSGATGIQWTHVPGYRGAVWNPTTGCTRVSPGCDHCYAFALHDQRYKANLDAARANPPLSLRDVRDGPDLVAAKRREDPGGMPVKALQYDVPFSQVQLLDEKRLTEPLRRRIPTAYFVDSMADLFHEDVPDGFLWQVWDVMRQSPQHLFMVLTKRPRRMHDFVTRWCDLAGESSEPQLVRGPDETRRRHPSGRGQLFASYLDLIGQPHGGVPPQGAAWPTFDWMEGPRWASWWWPNTPLPNVWLGVSVEDQERADERIPWLLDTPATVRFLSCEPLLGTLGLTSLDCWRARDGLDGESWEQEPVHPGHMEGLHWVIAGGESGRHARPFDLAWARSLRDQCAAAGVPFFMKQLGSKPMLPLTEDGNEEWQAGLFERRWRPQPDGSAFERNGLGMRCGYAFRLRNAHGADPAEWPEDLRVREWPEAKP